MATIPIEIILQDAKAPVDPTPTPEETNIVVPDTGAGTVGSGSTFSSSSAASIILPTILLVVALATICTVLVHKHRKHQNSDKLNKKEKLLTATSTTIAVLSATVLVGNLVIPATNAATSVEPGTAELDVVDKITITATREADSDTITATVKDTSYATANLDFGYKVTASMAEGTTTANLYLDGDTDSPYYIAPVSDGTLADNTWGYTLSEEAEGYLAIPLVDAPATITKGNDMVEDEAVDIYYTLKVDKDMPAGSYMGELEYTLTDNNFPSTLTTMQGMTTEICESTYTPGRQVTGPVPTATLEDTRDHNTYTIAKLADGKCWMTQNLDLDLKDDVTLTPADSDVSENWTPKNSTLSVEGTSVPGWSNSNAEPYSANPGNIYYYTSGNNGNDKQYDLLADCEREHPDGTCSHYHAGNYYNWSAAVASNNTTGMDTPYENAPNSICPAGWRLPEGPNAEGGLHSEIVDMIKSYETIIEENPSRGCGGNCWIYRYLESGFNIVRMVPLWLVRSGSILYGSLSGLGTGSYWSSTVISSSQGWRMVFDSDGVRPDSPENRHYGYSVRCIAK